MTQKYSPINTTNSNVLNVKVEDKDDGVIIGTFVILIPIQYLKEELCIDVFKDILLSDYVFPISSDLSKEEYFKKYFTVEIFSSEEFTLYDTNSPFIHYEFSIVA